MTQTCLIDTDPGIDDAIAILFAMRHPDLQVAALTTVAGNIGLATTTQNAARITALAAANVPVHPGAAAPLGRDPQPTKGIHGSDGLGGVPFPPPRSPAQSERAVEALARHLTDAPEGSVELHCLAPLTNIALLLEHAPNAVRRAARVIAMGGAVDEPGNVGPRAEFNIAHDPEAAQRVLSANLPLTLIPLDATRKFRADRAYVQTLRADDTPASRTSADLITAYFDATAHQAQGAESRPLHDPCVPLMSLRPDLFRIETRGLDVDAGGALVPGPYTIQVAMGLDADALRALLRDGLRT